VPKPYDDAMKRLVDRRPQDFLWWFFRNAQFVKQLPYELNVENVYADGLLEAIIDGKRALVHIEFQSYYDLRIGERLLEYNVLASRQYDYLRVYSWVIYLKDCGNVPQPPYIREWSEDEETIRFKYGSIELHKVTAAELRQKGLVGLLALLPLTKDGARHEVIEEMIHGLVAAQQTESLWIGYALAAKVMKHDLSWLRRRFAVFSDFLRDSPVYQEVLEEGLEKGREIGLEQGLTAGLRAGELHAQRQTLRELVNERFPELGYLAREQAEATDDAELLRRMTVKISVAQTPGDAEQYLLAISRRDKKN
jgi:predicted transposase YdaD